MTASGQGMTLRRLLLVSAAAVVPVLAGCQAGNNAPTLQFHYPTVTAGLVAGHLSIRNVFVLGAPLGHSLAAGQSASLFFAVVNNGSPDRLVSITAPGTATSVRLPAGGVPVDPGKPVEFGGPQPRAYLVGLTGTLGDGTTVKIVMNFQRQGPVTLEVPVMPRATHYVTYSPPPSPAPATTPTVSPTASPSSG